MKKDKLKQNSAITLIALVLTIVVLLILSGISISAIVGKNGIIDKATEAKYITKLKEYEERVTLVVASEKTLKVTEDKEERLINLVCTKLKEQEWVAEVKTQEQDNELEENEIKVITTDGFIVITKIEDDNDNSNKKSYTIRYDANGGTGAPDSQTKNYGENITLSVEIPTKSGYKFLGWATNNIATEATYKPGGEFTENKDIILYAVWEEEINSNNALPVINSLSVQDRNTDYVTIRANATDSDGDTLIYKVYLKEQNKDYSDTPNVISDETSSGEDIDLKVTGLSSYTVYQYKVEVTDGKDDVTSEEKTTGTGCSGNEYNCSDAKSYICSQTVVSGTRVCGGYGNATTSSSKCSSCGGNSVVTVTFHCTGCGTGYSQSLGCKNGTCSAYSNKTATSPGTHNVSVYTCSTHNYTGTSSTHTVYTPCKHGYNTSHKYCSHNKTSLHFPN